MAKKVNELRELKIPILTGTWFDLTQFDFSFKNIKIYDIQSKEFENYIEGLEPKNKEDNFYFISEIFNEINFEHDKKYAIVNSNPREHYDYQDIINVWRFLLIVYPSDLQIEYIVDYYCDEGWISVTGKSNYPGRMTGEYPGNLLFAKDNIDEVNEFAKRYFDKLKLTNYVGFAIENYVASYSASHLHYQYLTLCIALEAIIHGDTELSYRMRRTVSILCGEDIYNCEVIYENIEELFKLRNTIIHGSPNWTLKQVAEYLRPLKAIVSRTIIELLVHNISTNLDLSKIISRIGYGDRNKISANWKYYQLNTLSVVDSNWIKLKDKKRT